MTRNDTTGSGDPPVSRDNRDPVSERPRDRSDTGDGTGVAPGKTIGKFLREERQRKGLSYAQITERTRIRQPILEALEKEAWDKLASPAFARGFVRSYGNALGLDEETVMALFQESGPETVFVSTPLITPSGNNKILFAVAIFLILALFSVYFLWKGFALNRKVPAGHAPLSLHETSSATPGDTGGKHDLTKFGAPPGHNKPDAAPIPVPGSGRAKQAETPIRKNDVTADREASGPVDPGVTPAQGLTLQADIKKTTWVRIYVDDLAPKEYVFHPDEHFIWKGRKGFDLIIGNAAGIDFKLNGKPVETYGKPGQVIRLRLPAGHRKQKRD